MKKQFLLRVATILLTVSSLLWWVYPVCAETGWRGEYSRINGKTADVMSLTVAELKTLIADCDALKPLVLQQDETTRKVFLKKLQMTRDLLVFTLETKTQKVPDTVSSPPPVEPEGKQKGQ